MFQSNTTHILPVLTLTLLFLLITTRGISMQGKVVEYCQDEMFQPRCSSNEVIVMLSARYGHIQLGRCVDEDFGHLGCFSDQLAVLDRKCSGRKSCEIIFGDSDMDGDFPCTLSKALARYLEASFFCQEIYQYPNNQKCDSPTKVPVGARITYLSSLETSQTGCGEETKPWVLEAKEGQRINVSLLDFNWKVSSREHATVTCPVKYGYLVDTESNDVINLCGGIVRERPLYLSQGSTVQVAIDKTILKSYNFLIGYNAIGCPTFKNPLDTWMKEEEDHILVGCVASSDQWRMRCIGSHWLGPQRDCTKYKQSEKQIYAASSVTKEDHILGIPKVIAYAIFGGIFLMMISIIATVIIGVFCIRKSKPQQRNEYYLTPLPISVQPTLQQGGNDFPTYKSVNVNLSKKNGNVMPPALQNSSEFQNTMSSCSSVGRPPSIRDSPHYYLLEGRDTNETEPLYDVVYQATSGNNA